MKNFLIWVFLIAFFIGMSILTGGLSSLIMLMISVVWLLSLFLFPPDVI